MSAHLARRPESEVLREFFNRGACFALREASRRIHSPEAWVILDELAAEFSCPDCVGARHE